MNDSLKMTSSTNGYTEYHVDPCNRDRFIGTQALIDKQAQQLREFEQWYHERNWLAFHHHHYDWWMFPIDEISSRGITFQLENDDIQELKQDRQFIENLRRGVYLLACSWGWDIERGKTFERTDSKQQWSHWPVRLYKAGKCMWLFGQDDYYQSLKALARLIKHDKGERLDFFSHTKNGKADVLDEWAAMEQNR